MSDLFDSRAVYERLVVASAVADRLDLAGEFDGAPADLWEAVTAQTPSSRRSVGYTAEDFLPALREAAGDLTMRGWHLTESTDDDGAVTLRLRRGTR